jgi:dolichol-phosphate mannosyltransferase
MAARPQVISVVVPMLDEEDNVQVLHERLSAALATIEPSLDWELVYVDDGSTDGTPKLLHELQITDPHVVVVTLSRNFGHQAAITAGLDVARGDAVAVIDADLQDPPEVIPEMVRRWRGGARIVHAVRSEREGERRSKVVLAAGFYRVLQRLSDTPLTLDSGDFRLMDRRVVDQLRDMREDNRYLRGMVSWVGFAQEELPYRREARNAGVAKYSLRKSVSLALAGITAFSERPLRLATQVGALVTVFAFLLAVWTLVGRLVDPSRSIQGFASLMIAVLFIGGVQLLTIGLLGEYVGRIYREVKRRPLYVIGDVRRAGGGRSDEPIGPGA